MDFFALGQFLEEKGEPSFRLNQIRQAFFKERLSCFDQITTLSKGLREVLKEKFPWLSLSPEKVVGSEKEKVLKTAFVLSDNLKTESVLMFYRNWTTACLSVMVGCPLACAFCATGKMGFKRNLTTQEIVDQLAFWQQYLKPKGKRVGRVVFMGMGEPFLNWENTKKALQVLLSQDGFGLGQRKITLSTAGVTPRIYQFANSNTEINLAISLHSPFQEEREKLMPVAKKYPLEKLIKAANYYVDKTRRKLFFEYALIKGVNDRKKDAKELKKIFASPLFHLNLINLNPTGGSLSPSSKEEREKFTLLLEKERIPFTIRRSLGEKYQAACGQLAGK